MTPCEYRHDCWHEDTCCARETPLVKPGCWKEKGEGWKAEPYSKLFPEGFAYVTAILSNVPDFPKEGIPITLPEESPLPKEADQGELF